MNRRSNYRTNFFELCQFFSFAIVVVLNNLHIYGFLFLINFILCLLDNNQLIDHYSKSFFLDKSLLDVDRGIIEFALNDIIRPCVISALIIIISCQLFVTGGEEFKVKISRCLSMFKNNFFKILMAAIMVNLLIFDMAITLFAILSVATMHGFFIWLFFFMMPLVFILYSNLTLFVVLVEKRSFIRAIKRSSVLMKSNILPVTVFYIASFVLYHVLSYVCIIMIPQLHNLFEGVSNLFIIITNGYGFWQSIVIATMALFYKRCLSYEESLKSSS